MMDNLSTTKIDPAHAQSALLFLSSLPLCRAMEISAKFQNNELIFRLPYQATLLSAPQADNRICGGAISTLLDTACGAVIFAYSGLNNVTATISLRIDYMRAAKPERDIFAKAYLFKTTRHVAFVRGVAWDQDPADPIALAVGNFTYNKAQAEKNHV